MVTFLYTLLPLGSRVSLGPLTPGKEHQTHTFAWGLPPNLPGLRRRPFLRVFPLGATQHAHHHG